MMPSLGIGFGRLKRCQSATMHVVHPEQATDENPQELPTRTRKEEKIANLDAELFPGFVRSSSLAKQKSNQSRRTHSIATSRGLSHISQLTGSLASLASNLSEKERKSRFVPTKKRTAQLKQQVTPIFSSGDQCAIFAGMWLCAPAIMPLNWRLVVIQLVWAL